MIWENGIETCIIPYVKRIASPGLMHDTGCSGLVHWNDPEGCVGREVGGGGSGWETRVHPWWIHVDVWQNQYNIVKFKKKVFISAPHPLRCFSTIFYLALFFENSKDKSYLCSPK